MNYSKEINTFYDLMKSEPLSASAVNLWHTLLHINCKERWSIEIAVPSNVLRLNGSLSESSFQRARKELLERGFITFRSRGENLTPAYHMKQLYRKNEGDDDMGQMGQEVNMEDPFFGDA